MLMRLFFICRAKRAFLDAAASSAKPLSQMLTDDCLKKNNAALNNSADL